MTAARKALLLRVGIDRGTGGALSPIFADGTFEYVPIPEDRPTRCGLTFATLPTRQVPSLAAFVPRRIALRHPHIDPDFAAFVYGDAAPRKRRQLLRLAAGDLLVFYAGFAPWPSGDIPRLFIIGYLEVREVRALSIDEIVEDQTLRRRFGNTAHFLRDPPDPELALIVGDERRSRLLDRALPIGDGEDRLLPDLAALGYRGSLRRAVGHWFNGSAADGLENWLRRGPPDLVDDGARLFAVSAAAIEPAKDDRGAVVIADARPGIGDWVYSNAAGAFALARVNARTETGAGHASLFWWVRGLSGEKLAGIPIPGRGCLSEGGNAALHHLVSWAASHYRIGIHS